MWLSKAKLGILHNLVYMKIKQIFWTLYCKISFHWKVLCQNIQRLRILKTYYWTASSEVIFAETCSIVPVSLSYENQLTS